MMVFAPTVSALLIALSVAVLPAAGAFALDIRSDPVTEISDSEPMHDCCPHAANPCDKLGHKWNCMATCALNCFSFAATTIARRSDLQAASPAYWLIQGTLPTL